MNEETAVIAIREVLQMAQDTGRLEVGVANRLVSAADLIYQSGEPILFDMLEGTVRPGVFPLLSLAEVMARAGWRDAAHALLYLRYDQILKQEQVLARRIHTGSALFELARLHQSMGEQSLCHHYAALAVAADVLWEPELPSLMDGGAALPLLSMFEPRAEIERWRIQMRQTLNDARGNQPIYPEAGLAMHWFSPGRLGPILEVANLDRPGPANFIEALLQAGAKGVRFDAAVGVLLSATPGFEVRSAFSESDEHVDLIVQRRREPGENLRSLIGYGLIECRATNDAVDAPQIRDFGAKCFLHDAQFGILASLKGITGARPSQSQSTRLLQAGEFTRRKFRLKGSALLVITEEDVLQARTRVSGLADALRADYERLAFGTRG